MRNMANGAATSKVLEYPTLANPKEQPKPVEFSWAKRRLLELGVIAMPDSPTQSPGFYVNFSTVSFLILVLGTIAGLWWFTWQAANEAGYQRGKDEIEKQMLRERLQKAEKDAETAARLASAVSGTTGHDKKEK